MANFPQEFGSVRPSDGSSADQTRWEWVGAVADHPLTTKPHYAAAAVVAHNTHLPSEHIPAADDLVKFKLAVRNPDGTYAAITPFV